MYPANFTLRIGDAEFRERCQALLAYVVQQQLTGVVLFDADYIKYYTGFAFIPTERPIAFAMSKTGERAMLVPRLEVEHAQAHALIDTVTYYAEYPGERHPAHVLAEMLRDMGFTRGSEIGADSDGYPWILGYRGPALSEMLGVRARSVRGMIEDAMAIKSNGELKLIRESVRWANLAHTLLQRYTVVGATETEVSERASREATAAMLDAIGPLYKAQAQAGVSAGAFAGYRGQIGRNSAIPHALANNITFQRGDTLVTGASAPV